MAKNKNSLDDIGYVRPVTNTFLYYLKHKEQKQLTPMEKLALKPTYDLNQLLKTQRNLTNFMPQVSLEDLEND